MDQTICSGQETDGAKLVLSSKSFLSLGKTDTSHINTNIPIEIDENLYYIIHFNVIDKICFVFYVLWSLICQSWNSYSTQSIGISPPAIYLTPLRFSFLVYKMGISSG